MTPTIISDADLQFFKDIGSYQSLLRKGFAFFVIWREIALELYLN